MLGIAELRGTVCGGYEFEKRRAGRRVPCGGDGRGRGRRRHAARPKGPFQACAYAPPPCLGRCDARVRSAGGKSDFRGARRRKNHLRLQGIACKRPQKHSRAKELLLSTGAGAHGKSPTPPPRAPLRCCVALRAASSLRIPGRASVSARARREWRRKRAIQKKARLLRVAVGGSERGTSRKASNGGGKGGKGKGETKKGEKALRETCPKGRRNAAVGGQSRSRRVPVSRPDRGDADANAKGEAAGSERCGCGRRAGGRVARRDVEKGARFSPRPRDLKVGGMAATGGRGAGETNESMDWAERTEKKGL